MSRYYYYNTDLAVNLNQIVSDIIFTTTSERFRIKNSGLIGIANSSPSGLFDISGSIAVQNNGIVLLNNSTNGATRGLTQGITSNEILGISSMNFTSAGNTTAGADAGQLRVSAGGATNTIHKTYIDFNGYGVRFISFVVYGGEKMRIIDGIGIATSGVTSGSILDINGVTTLRGNILPRTTSSANIGSTSLFFNNLYCNQLYLSGFLSRGAPVTKTSSFSVGANENWIICNGSASITVTLPTASSPNVGREIMFKNIANQTVISASSNVYSLNSNTLGNLILNSSAGSTATLVSDGTNWVRMQ
jgi:hypothetical protein